MLGQVCKFVWNFWYVALNCSRGSRGVDFIADTVVVRFRGFKLWCSEKEDSMGLQADSAFGSNFERSFEPDEFYESFQAPKFHDFTAPEEPIDPDAFFMAQPGMVAKKAVVMEDVKMMAPKILKVTAQGFPKTAQGGVLEIPPKAPLSTEKAVWSSKNPCSFLLPLVMSNLKMLGSLSPF